MVGIERRFFGLVIAEIDAEEKRVKVFFRSPGSERYSLGEQGRSFCMAWALKRLEEYMGNVYVWKFHKDGEKC